MTGNKKKNHPAPWLTDDILLLLEKKKKLMAKYKLNKTDVIAKEYRKIRNLCNNLCRDAQRLYEGCDDPGKITLKS